MEKIKVLHLIKTLSLGGAEKNLFNLVSSFDRERLEIHVGYSYGGEFEERFKCLGIKLLRFSETSDKIKSFATLKIIPRLGKYILKNRIQIVHSHSFNTHVWGSVAAKMTRTRLVEHIHDARYLDPEDLARRRCLTGQIRYTKHMRNVADKVVVLTERYRRFLLQKGFCDHHHIRKILNGIPLNGGVRTGEATRILKKRLGLSNKDQVILTSLRMSAEKNVDLIFRIAPFVASAVPNVVFLISGSGPQFDEFNAKSRELKSCRIKLIGYYPEILDLLAISDVFLLPSLQELHSIAILEALSMKVPVVTSQNVGCNDEFITSWRNGVLLNPFSDAGWAEAIIRLLREPDLRKQIGERGYETCLSRFDIRKVAREFEDLYCEIL
ncbi:MAG: hypothetical protein CVU64_02425 [Deltaproteobacteria bacterium HGW-Deltaproteobacteria-21]|nr:MAG: hypothetical protein CVU64_02425 [Deltaproteobacteria bacterium HGW-Deltaproteobacteria-21]